MYAAGGAAGTFGLSTMFGGLFGGGSSSGGGISDVIQLLPLVIIGGGILYAVNVFKK
jgi:flagellar motor component MotA